MAQEEWVKLEDLSESQLTPMLKQYLQAKAESGKGKVEPGEVALRPLPVCWKSPTNKE